ncbi:MULTISPECIES: hypothetical protein [Bacillus]|uniref:hypothetical protein n=1 Tax=Bacillus TaxID=1386 RepID=UPI000BF9EC25|nr:MULTISPECIES: hypothetical protein [Bacillus]MBY7131135.1 hypothetical protein [Bacillus sp. 8YEL33]PGE92305.1 hypothetical protein COM75_06795 [Bacillus toyonensis]
MENKKVIDIDDLAREVSKWANHHMEIRGRNKLVISDELWDKTFIDLQNNKDDLKIQPLIVKPNTSLYRVHIGGNDEPDYDDYNDRGKNQNKDYAYDYNEWLDENNADRIRFNNHWVSFTKCVGVIGSNYFAQWGRRGFVIVISSGKAIDISSFRPKAFDEKEVVAPMNEETVKEILPFKDFMKKYGTATTKCSESL